MISVLKTENSAYFSVNVSLYLIDRSSGMSSTNLNRLRLTIPKKIVVPGTIGLGADKIYSLKLTHLKYLPEIGSRILLTTRG